MKLHAIAGQPSHKTSSKFMPGKDWHVYTNDGLKTIGDVISDYATMPDGSCDGFAQAKQLKRRAEIYFVELECSSLTNATITDIQLATLDKSKNRMRFSPIVILTDKSGDMVGEIDT